MVIRAGSSSFFHPGSTSERTFLREPRLPARPLVTEREQEPLEFGKHEKIVKLVELEQPGDRSFFYGSGRSEAGGATGAPLRADSGAPDSTS